MPTQANLKPVRASMMNAVHDLALLVARDEGLFRDEGLEVEIVHTPGTAQVNADHQALRDGIFDRTMEASYHTGEVDQYRMCEWGVMKRTVEAVQSGQRAAKVVALGAAMSKMAIITAPNGHIYEPEQLKSTPVAVSPFHGSHFTTLKMLEGFVKQEHILTVNAGTMQERLEAVRTGLMQAGRKAQQTAPSMVDNQVIMGDDFAERFNNASRNVREQRIVLIFAVAERA